MHSVKHLKAMTIEAKKKEALETVKYFDDRFYEILARLPELTEKSAQIGQDSCIIHSFKIQTSLWKRILFSWTENKWSWSAENPSEWEHLILPLKDYLIRHGFKISFISSPSNRQTLMASWR